VRRLLEFERADQRWSSAVLMDLEQCLRDCHSNGRSSVLELQQQLACSVHLLASGCLSTIRRQLARLLHDSRELCTFWGVFLTFASSFAQFRVLCSQWALGLGGCELRVSEKRWSGTAKCSIRLLMGLLAVGQKANLSPITCSDNSTLAGPNAWWCASERPKWRRFRLSSPVWPL